MSAQDLVDASDHYELRNRDEDIPSLLALVIDTNPRAWAALSNTLPVSKAIANLLIFVNAHLTFNNANQVAIIAAHTQRAEWLYPRRPKPSSEAQQPSSSSFRDVEMTDAPPRVSGAHSANKYPQFSDIETCLFTTLRYLVDSTSPSDLSSITSQVAGALTLALAHINKASLAIVDTQTSSSSANAAAGASWGPSGSSASTTSPGLKGLHARVVVLSVSDSAPAQYIPMMNAIFAATHAQIPIDVLSLYGTAPFLQQASFITRGAFVCASHFPQGLLTYLMFGLSSNAAPLGSGGRGGSDVDARKGDGAKGGDSFGPLLVLPGAESVDFRAACFCHRRVVHTGFVCSICLSIFCGIPQGAKCLTCGTTLALGSYGNSRALLLAAAGDAASGRRKEREAQKTGKRKMEVNGWT